MSQQGQQPRRASQQPPAKTGIPTAKTGIPTAKAGIPAAKMGRQASLPTATVARQGRHDVTSGSSSDDEDFRGAMRRTKPAGMFKVTFVCMMHVVLSGGLIFYNKFLLDPSRFPHAAPLATCQIVLCWLAATGAYLVYPKSFKGLKSMSKSKSKFQKGNFVILGALYALMLSTTYRALIYCNIPFLQYMKQLNLALVFILSCIMGSQSLDRVKALLLGCIVTGTLVCVQVENDVILAGLLCQMVGQFADCGRIVLGERLFSAQENIEIDPLSYTMLMAPSCVLCLLIDCMVSYGYDKAIILEMGANWPHLVLCSILAMFLNMFTAIVLQVCTASSYVMSGIAKDVLVVLISAALGVLVARQQYIGFSLSIIGVSLWSMLRLYAENPAVMYIQRMLGIRTHQTPLLGGKDVASKTAPLVYGTTKGITGPVVGGRMPTRAAKSLPLPK